MRHPQQWKELLHFESRDLIERYIKVKSGRSASKAKVVEISSNIIQGKEYFKTAENASISVKPLLLYYGVSALTRAMILATNAHISESALTPAHGLQTNDWQNSLSNNNYDRLSVTITAGTFYDLLKFTSNTAHFKVNTSGVDWTLCFPVPEPGTTFTFLDFLQTTTSLNNELELWTQNKTPHLHLRRYLPKEDGTVQFEISRHCTDEDIRSVFPDDQVYDLKFGRFTDTIMISYQGTFLPHFSQTTYEAMGYIMGNVFMCKPISGTIYLSPIAQMYALSFFLGMLCRYFPTKWVPLGRVEKGDAIFPLINQSIEIIERTFPDLILQYLNAPY